MVAVTVYNAPDMDAKGVRNMQSIHVVVNKHNIASVASCWFIIYYRLVMHGNSNIKKTLASSGIRNPDRPTCTVVTISPEALPLLVA